MHDETQPEWQLRLGKLRAGQGQTHGPKAAAFTGCISQEALMTLIAIMKDHDDPRLQIAAAKVLLEKGGKIPQMLQPKLPTTDNAMSQANVDDVDAAIALAKAILDELAARKTQHLDGKGAMAVAGTAGTDNAAG